MGFAVKIAGEGRVAKDFTLFFAFSRVLVLGNIVPEIHDLQLIETQLEN